jgi:two-component system, OmpR family, sensor histidine kinase TctE
MRRETPLLRTQLLRWLLWPLLALMVAGSAVSYGIAASFAEHAYDRTLVEIARDLSLHLSTGVNGPSLDLPAESRRILMDDPVDRIAFEVLRTDGTTIAGERLPPPAPAGNARQEVYDAQLRGVDVRVVQLHVPDRQAIVRVAETTAKRTSLAREILASVMLPEALMVLAAAMLVWIGVVRGLAPLERIRRELEARSHRDWSALPARDVPGELRPLLQSINELVTRLDQALTLQHRFIADAAHQLKTPVSVLRAQLELALREHDPERQRQAVTSSLTGLERLSRVISQLLSLARNEPEGAAKLTLAPVDLNALALEAAQAWVPEALRKRIDLGFEGPEAPVVVAADAARLRELLDNLIDNAVRYSPQDAHVTVRVSGSGPPTVSVSDDGPRIPPEDRRRVFERFHRLLGTQAEGSGLGLAIVDEIARLHGARIELRDDDDGVGNTFSVCFPA